MYNLIMYSGQNSIETLEKYSSIFLYFSNIWVSKHATILVAGGAFAIAIAGEDYATIQQLEEIEQKCQQYAEQAAASAEEAATSAGEAAMSAGEAAASAGEATGAATEATGAASSASGSTTAAGLSAAGALA